MKKRISNQHLNGIDKDQFLDFFKEEIANELGISLSVETSSKENGMVGGEMVKRMIQMAENDLYPYH